MKHKKWVSMVIIFCLLFSFPLHSALAEELVSEGQQEAESQEQEDVQEQQVNEAQQQEEAQEQEVNEEQQEEAQEQEVNEVEQQEEAHEEEVNEVEQQEETQQTSEQNVAEQETTEQLEGQDAIEQVDEEQEASEKQEIETQQASDEIVHFNDANLEQLVKDTLGIEGRDLTRGDLEQLTQLQNINSNSPNVVIEDLTGLEHAVNLTQLNFSNSGTSDFSVLSSLENLRFLIIQNNTDVDLHTLAGLDSLENLSLPRTGLTDIEPLTVLTHLRGLSIDGNEIVDLSPLSHFENLRTLSIDNNPVSDITPILSQPNLRSIYAKYTNINNINGLEDLEELSILNIQNNSLDLSESSDTWRVIQTLKDQGTTVIYDGAYYSVTASEISDTKMTINWEANPHNQYERIHNPENYDRYQIRVYNESGRTIYVSDEIEDINSYTVTCLTPSTTYKVVLRSFSDTVTFIGTISISETVYFETLEDSGIIDEECIQEPIESDPNDNFRRIAEQYPADNLQLKNVTPDSITVKWSTDDLAFTTFSIALYDLSLEPGSRAVQQASPTDVNEYTFSGLDPNKEYFVGIMAADVGEVTFDLVLYEYLQVFTLPAGDSPDGSDGTQRDITTYVPESTVGTITVPEDVVNDVSENGILVIDITSGTEEVSTVQLTAYQIQALRAKNASIEIQKHDITMDVPIANMSDNEDTEFIIKKNNDVKDADKALSTIYSFSIKQNGQYIRQFDEAVTLTFTVDESKVNHPDRVRVFYYNEETGEWELVGGVYSNGKITVQVTHFSTFAVFEAEEQEGTQSPSQTEEGHRLPDTATEYYNLALAGSVLLVIGLLTLVARRKRQTEAV